MICRLTTLITISSTLIAGGCGGLSDVGEQEEKAPTATAEVVGYGAPDSSGDVTVDVRAQSELLLTGKDSQEADAPIVSFLWEAANSAASTATLTVRNSSTVSVSVPRVAEVTDMQFRLTVEESDGDTDTAMVTLRVQPVLDSDRFLAYLQGTGKLQVVAGTSHPAANSAGFQLALQARVTYQTRSGVANTVTYGLGDRVEGRWVASTDNNDALAADLRNPRFQFPIPSVDLDAITRQFQSGLPGSAPQLADPAFTDEASVEAILTLTPLDATSNVAIYVLDSDENIVAQQDNGGSGAAVELILSAAQVEELRIAGGGLENRDTAESYYKAIDPDDRKLTLKQWLTENCFDPAGTNYGADAHAVYVNNFDLGFGRDMYFRTERPANCTSATFQPGDAASVVINYATLEAAAKKIDPIIAVAMEFRAHDAIRSEPGVATFYVFAPDEGTGEFRRVRTANFDGRGEKFVPGACAVCHGGRPKTPAADRTQTYSSASAAGIDVGATFMPWDLESFLFSDTDSAFPSDASNASLRSQLTRSQQEAELKKLNLAAYGTYGGRPGSQFQCHAEFGGPCELVELWYGGSGMPSANFLDQQVAPGWIAGGNNPPSAPGLYLDVYARNCRSCHTQRVIPLAAGSDPQFRTYEEFVQTSDPAWRDKVIEQVFQLGGMPAARLTMDRLWQPNGSTSAGMLLAEHLGVPAESRPGASIVCFSSLGTTPEFSLSPDNRQTIERRDGVTGEGKQASFSADCSAFAGAIAWQLARPEDSAAALTADQGLTTAFSPDKPGDYDLILTVTSPTGATSSLTKYARVENLTPTAPDLASTVPLAVATPIDVLTSPGDLPSTVRVDSVSPGLAASVDANQRILVTAGGLAGGTIGYSIIDVDGGAENTDAGVITVSVTATINANPPATTPSFFANTANNEIDLTDAIASQGQDVNVTITSNPRTSLVGTNPPADRGDVTIGPCTAVNDRICAFYTPPVATISHFGLTQVGTADTFVYQACFQDQPATCDDATVTVQIAGARPFTPVANLLRSSTCLSGCHGAAQVGSSWTLTAASSEKAAWCAVRFKTGDTAGGQYPADSGLPLVDPSAPTSSLLYRKPAATIVHVGMPAVSQAQLDAISEWINEGGAFTSGSDQTCP